jgi:hypothetical protein
VSREGKVKYVMSVARVCETCVCLRAREHVCVYVVCWIQIVDRIESSCDLTEPEKDMCVVCVCVCVACVVARSRTKNATLEVVEESNPVESSSCVALVRRQSTHTHTHTHMPCSEFV